MTLEEQLEEQAKRGLMSLGLEEDTAETWGPWAALAAQFIPGVGEGVGVDLTRDAIQDERYGDAAIEGGLTLLGAVPIVGDFAAAAIKGIRRAPTSLLDDAVDAGKKVEFDEAAWLKENPRPEGPASSPEVRQWYRKKDYEKHGDKRREAKRDAYNEDQEASAARQKERYHQDVERIRERDRAYRDRNREKRNQYAKDWRDKNPALHASRSKASKAKRQKRLPQWRDQDKIDEIYRAATEASRITGVPHEVDHVVPLLGREVSGLHHQDNLLVVPKSANRGKGNIFEPGDLPPRAGVRKSRAYLKKLKEAQEAARRK